MRTHVTIVLYNPTSSEAEQVSSHWTRLRSEIERVHILCSGDSAAHVVARHFFADEIFTLTLRYDNLGFASGHNFLISKAYDAGAEHVLVANPDLYIEVGAISSLSDHVARVSDANLVGPVLERLDEDWHRTGLADSLGIRWDRWARHFDIGQGSPMDRPPRSRERVRGVSGACLLVPHDAYEKIREKSGYFFDDFYLAYREDAELGVRATFAGVGNLIVPVEGFAHVRNVRGSQRGKVLQDLLGVKNRLLLKYNLGRHRPGSWPLATVRDTIVAVAAHTIERTSRDGFKAARAIRRAARTRGFYSRSKN